MTTPLIAPRMDVFTYRKKLDDLVSHNNSEADMDDDYCRKFTVIITKLTDSFNANADVVCKALGISKKTLCDWRNGDYNHRLNNSTIGKFFKVIGVEPPKPVKKPAKRGPWTITKTQAQAQPKPKPEVIATEPTPQVKKAKEKVNQDVVLITSTVLAAVAKANCTVTVSDLVALSTMEMYLEKSLTDDLVTCFEFLKIQLESRRESGAIEKMISSSVLRATLALGKDFDPEVLEWLTEAEKNFGEPFNETAVKVALSFRE